MIKGTQFRMIDLMNKVELKQLGVLKIEESSLQDTTDQMIFVENTHTVWVDKFTMTDNEKSLLWIEGSKIVHITDSNFTNNRVDTSEDNGGYDNSNPLQFLYCERCYLIAVEYRQNLKDAEDTGENNELEFYIAETQFNDNTVTKSDYALIGINQKILETDPPTSSPTRQEDWIDNPDALKTKVLPLDVMLENVAF